VTAGRAPDPLMLTCKARRIKLGLSITHAAKDLDRSVGILAGYERGTRIPPLPEARRYAAYLGLIVVGLLADGGDEPGCEIVGGVDVLTEVISDAQEDTDVRHPEPRAER
jgi:transcriptional regulator with XRE-family HTH domain